MKLKIKIKEITEGCMPEIIKKGEWIDLRAAEDTTIKPAQAGIQYQENNQKYRDVKLSVSYIKLGVAMQLPKGFEAIIAPRSSCPSKFNIFEPNSIGIIDSSYCGNDDEWCMIVSPLAEINIKKGDRICQFRIQLSQKATIWQKLKWLFSSGIELIKVDNLNNKNRSGFGSTGIR